jgi:predicted DNA-binding transcriptional regulator AlpA
METKLLLSARDAQKMGLSRTMAYQLLNREDVPVVQIGGRKFFNAEKFREWLDKQAMCKQVS